MAEPSWEPADTGAWETAKGKERNKSEGNRPGLAQPLLYFSCVEDHNESFFISTIGSFYLLCK